jgi:hypothetical protein
MRQRDGADRAANAQSISAGVQWEGAGELKRIQNFILVVLFFSPVVLAADSWTLVGADFLSRPITLLGIDAKGVRVASDDASNEQTIGWDKVLELDHPAYLLAASGPPGFALHLNGGDVIAGDPISITDDQITWRQPLLGRMQIPEDRVSAIVRVGQSVAGLEEARRADSVRLVNGDVTSGVVNSMDESGVNIQPAGADSPARIGMDKIAAIVLADPDPLAAAAGGWRVWLADGSSLTVPIARLAPSQGGKLEAGFSEQRISSVDLSAVTCIEQINGPVRWLTSLSPRQVDYHPYLEENFPPRFDHPVDDSTVSIRAKFPPFRHGIGVHSYTKLTYAVPEGFHTFRTQFEIERIAGSDPTQADVPARILLDGKVAEDFPHVRIGPAAGPVIIDVSGAKELSLEVDFGDDLNAQGRFLWLDPAFAREAAKPQ